MGSMAGRFMLDEYRAAPAGRCRACEVTDVHVQLWNALEAGDEPRAREAFAALLPGVNYERLLHVPFVKGLLQRLGVVRSTATRMPAAPLDRHDWAEIDRLWPAWKPFFQPVAASPA